MIQVLTALRKRFGPKSKPPETAVASAPSKPDPSGLVEFTFGPAGSRVVIPTLLYNLAFAHQGYDEQGREIIARELIARICHDVPFSDVLRYMEGTFELHYQAAGAIAFAEGDLDRSLGFFDKARAEFPTAFNQLCYGRVLMALGRLADATSHFSEQHRLRPDDPHAGMSLATLLFWSDEVDRANAVLAKFSHLYESDRPMVESRQSELDRAISTKQIYPDEADDFYTDEYVERTLWAYWQTWRLSPFRAPEAALYASVTGALAKLLSEIEGITTFVDFGAFYGKTIDHLAGLFPAIRFIGVDRPNAAKRLNDRLFSRPNLSFVAADLEREIDQWGDLGNAMLFHSRTGTFCYPEYLRSLYRKARTKGVRHIAWQESETFSRRYMKFFEWGKFPEITITSRGKLLMHDYKHLLGDAGFEIAGWKPAEPTNLCDDMSGYGYRHRLVHAVASSQA